MDIKYTKKTIDNVETQVSDTGHLTEYNAKDSPVETVNWQANQISAKSSTHLEDDQGVGKEVVIRCFEFEANPVAFKTYVPTKQELFNFHVKHLEMLLWRDNLTVIPEVQPQIQISKDKNKYRIFVGARAIKGQAVYERPQKLSELIPK